MNPIEKMFDVLIARICKRARELSFGESCSFNEADFVDCVSECQVTRRIYQCVFSDNRE